MASGSSEMQSETSPDPEPLLSIVLPAYNEEDLLEESVEGLLDCLDGRFEVLIAENGSTDRTGEIARRMAEKHSMVVTSSLGRPSYGEAVRQGMRHARGQAVAIFNVDFWDLNFLRSGVPLLEECDVVVGSKALDRSLDRRPRHRRWITRAFNSLLSIVFGFRGTDTHGLKIFRAEALRQILPRCKTRGEIFDTELILRCYKAGLRVRELPVEVREMRPSRYSLLGRVPSTARDLVSLFIALH